jgi:signal transduction histidine kinase
MAANALRALWAEPRPPHPLGRAWYDWGLVAVLISWSVIETVLRQDLTWRPVMLAAGVVVAFTLLWRRSHPLAAVTVAFGTLAGIDLARIFEADETSLPSSISAAVLLPYSLFRWGAGRQALIGLVPILAWLAVTHVADPVSAWEVAAAYAFFLCSAALGMSIRYYANVRTREIEQAKLRERIQIARELHDTVGHHVSAIAIQAQAGQSLAASDPDRALATLKTIEEAASRALEEMRSVVGVLREGAGPVLAPQPTVTDIKELVRNGGEWPRVDVQLPGNLNDLSPSVGVALYRIAREGVTNAVRHARHATRVVVRVVDEGEQVRLTVRDDGDGSIGGTPPGYGLVGMAERVSMLGGTLEAGPDPGGGWTIDAVLPKGVATT